MNSNGFKERINYSKDKKEKELQELMEERNKLLKRSDQLNLEEEKLQKERERINHILMMWYNSRTIDKKEIEIHKIDIVRDRIKKIGIEKDELRIALRQNRKRMGELQQTSKIGIPDIVSHFPSL